VVGTVVAAAAAVADAADAKLSQQPHHAAANAQQLRVPAANRACVKAAADGVKGSRLKLCPHEEQSVPCAAVLQTRSRMLLLLLLPLQIP